MFIEKSKECHLSQPNPNTKRKRKRTEYNAFKYIQTTTREAHRPDLSSLSEVITMLNRTKQHENKEQGKTQLETASNKTHKAI